MIWNFRDASLFGKPLHEALSGEASVAQFYRNLAQRLTTPVPTRYIRSRLVYYRLAAWLMYRT